MPSASWPRSNSPCGRTKTMASTRWSCGRSTTSGRASSQRSSPRASRGRLPIEAGLRPPRLLVGNLDARRDLTDVRDTVRAYIALMAHGRSGQVYNVSCGTALRIGEILERLLALARVPIEVATDPPCSGQVTRRSSWAHTSASRVTPAGGPPSISTRPCATCSTPGASTCAQHTSRRHRRARARDGRHRVLGRAIVRAVRDRGHTVVAFARRASAAGLGVECVDGDVTDAGSVNRAVAACDAVCHAAALVANGGPIRQTSTASTSKVRARCSTQCTGVASAAVSTPRRSWRCHPPRTPRR